VAVGAWSKAERARGIRVAAKPDAQARPPGEYIAVEYVLSRVRIVLVILYGQCIIRDSITKHRFFCP
jgi:hypothetical protein